jgi:hypothetical protein
MPDTTLDAMPDAARFPFLGLVHGGYKSDGELDPITKIKITGLAMIEYLNIDQNVVVVGSDNLKGALDLAEEAMEAIASLGNLGFDWINDCYASDDLPKAELQVYGKDVERIILIQPFEIYYTINE